MGPLLPDAVTQPATLKASSPKKSPPGTCPECKRTDQVLYNCKHQPGEKYCTRCVAKFAFRAKKAGQQSAKKAPSAAPVPSAPKATGPEKVATNRPAPAMTTTPGRAFVPLTARSLVEALQVKEVGLLITCRTAAAVLAIIRAAENDQDVMIAVGAGTQK